MSANSNVLNNINAIDFMKGIKNKQHRISDIYECYSVVKKENQFLH